VVIFDSDLRWMDHALELAERGRCGVSPNPMVGAVVLDADSRMVGEGFHVAWGGPHAEVHALAAAGERARGGTLFVTLEPCAHHGKTPPCTDAVIAAGIRRVVIAMPDPNRAAAGGARQLRAAGLDVVEDVRLEEARRLNRRWLRWATENRPWITLKAAVSMDGRIATRTGESQWITSDEARARGHELREEHDAIVVGIGTVLADDPRLTRRLGRNPVHRWLRVVLDSSLRTPPDSQLVATEPEGVLLIHTESAPDDRRRALKDRGVRTTCVAAEPSGRVSIGAALIRLAEHPVAAALVEGGAGVHGACIDAGVVDEVELFMAPVMIGGVTAPTAVGGMGVPTLDDAAHYVFENVVPRGPDLEIHAVCKEYAGVHGIG
jgi:diaminohydroxyphosphoribosylaminopyrimidine deaminase/5-amino-6-(5-phosphoribosylamino)uracil reductase